MLDLISAVAILGSIACLVAFLILALKKVPDATARAHEQINELKASNQQLAGASVKDLAELVKALATFAEALVKAGPAFWSLMGSLLFLLIAALAAGAFTSS